MIDPKKLMAFVQRENKVQPMAPPVPPEEEEMMLEEEEMPEEEETEEEEGEEEITEEEIEEIAELIEAGEGDPMLLQLAAEIAAEIEEFGEEAEQPPAWVGSPDVWERAKKAVDPEGKGAKYTEPYAVTTHVYKKMGGVVT